jgi:plastocyanin
MRRRLARLHWKPAVLALLALMAGTAGLLASEGKSADASNSMTAYIGVGRDGISVNLFLPEQILIHRGDTVTWHNPYEEPHTLTYLVGNAHFEFEEVANTQAAANFDGTQAFTSGFVNKGDNFAVKFAALGAYKFICLLHPGMEVDVLVLPEGTRVPPQGANSPENIRIQEEAIAIGEAAAAAVVVPGPTRNANGTQTHTVLTGPGIPYRGASVDVMKFFPARINIGVGDTITWVDETFVPHTVTFFPPGGPGAGFNPFVPVIPNNNRFDPRALINSGIISNIPEFGAVTRFSLTFNQPGTYPYICVLHADQGMAGVVVVGDAVSTPPTTGGITPPSTGDAGLIERGSSAWMIYTGLALLAASFAAGFVAIRR